MIRRLIGEIIYAARWPMSRHSWFIARDFDFSAVSAAQPKWALLWRVTLGGATGDDALFVFDVARCADSMPMTLRRHARACAFIIDIY